MRRAASRAIAEYYRLIRHCSRPSVTTKKGVLFVHQLLLGDAVLSFALIDRLLESFPKNMVTVACPEAYHSLYSVFFPTIRIVPFSERQPWSVIKLLKGANFEVGFAAFETRMPRYLQAAGCPRIVTFGGPPTRPQTFSDMLYALPGPYAHVKPFARHIKSELNRPEATSRSVLIHTDARNPNRRWSPKHWEELSRLLRGEGFRITWSFGPDVFGPDRPRPELSDAILEKRSLPDLVRTISDHSLLICPDTGVAHLAKLTLTPTIVIYGQGSPVLHGNGDFWRLSHSHSIFETNVPCRDKKTIMGHHVEWLNRCDRGPKDCSDPACQLDISAARVVTEAKQVFPGLFKEAHQTRR